LSGKRLIYFFLEALRALNTRDCAFTGLTTSPLESEAYQLGDHLHLILVEHAQPARLLEAQPIGRLFHFVLMSSEVSLAGTFLVLGALQLPLSLMPELIVPSIRPVILFPNFLGTLSNLIF
jgi:hypothetical protein